MSHIHVRYLQLYELNTELVGTDHTCTCNAINTFYGGSTQKMLTRNRLVGTPGGRGGLLVCASDEATQAVCILCCYWYMVGPPGEG